MPDMWSIKVVGTPAPKGSMKPFIDTHGRARVHEDKPASQTRWRKLVTAAGERLSTPAAGQLADGPVAVHVTFTIERPVSIRGRLWPHKKTNTPGHGDVDKLSRLILDAFTDSKLWGDDSQVCELIARKAYPDTPGWPDVLDRAGAVIRVAPIAAEPVELDIRTDDTLISVGHGQDCVAMSLTGDDDRRFGVILTSKQAFALARTLEYQARYAAEAVLV